MTKIFIFIIECYQKLISPCLVGACRFYPTCSQYSKQSLEKHGLVKGTAYSFIRILKCHPFHPGGYDPVK
ncbi:MAG TPA: membrane protein insertion efficiency factor YidD [Geobacteraceae bacterium]|nr:membrane protein insertion efficiency factor YidD [Geobacteraceae bacterium]